jgi:hypothetical protein
MRASNFPRLAAARPVNRQAATVVPTAPRDGQQWSSLTLDLREQHRTASEQAERLGEMLAAMGYPTPYTPAAWYERRHQLARRVEHYERLCRELSRELQAHKEG